MRLNAYENDRLQQYTRRENIRISGITEAEGEQLKAKIVNIASDMGLNHWLQINRICLKIDFSKSF